MDQASFSLDSLPLSESACPHCGKSGHSISHGYVYKQIAIDQREIIGKRILCSQRYGRKGCGRTRQWYLKDIVPRRHYRLRAFIAFVAALLGGDVVEQAYLKAIGRSCEPRHAWRWLKGFLKQLPRWRRYLSLGDETHEATQRSSTLKVILPTLRALLGKLGCLSDFQVKFQQAFY